MESIQIISDPVRFGLILHSLCSATVLCVYAGTNAKLSFTVTFLFVLLSADASPPTLLFFLRIALGLLILLHFHIR